MLLILALTLFFAIHILPFHTAARARLTQKVGEQRYKTLFRFCVVAIVIMGIIGWSRFPNVVFYEPSVALKQVHLVVMFIVVYLWVVAEVPNNLKRFIKHPMLPGTQLGCVSHLLANADLRTWLFFGSFLVFSTWAIYRSNRRGTQPHRPTVPKKMDAIALGLSATAYSLVAYFHESLFGMPALPYFFV